MGLSRIGRRLIIVGTIVVAALALVTAWLVLTQRAATLAESSQASADLAQVLAEQTSRTMLPIDLTLREVAGRFAAQQAEGATAGLQEKAMFDLLAERQKGLPQVDALILVGADGRVANFSRSFPPAPLDTSRRDYYQYLKTHDDHALFISVPAQSFLDHQWIVFLARRLNDAHGEFAGIVAAAVTLSYLEDFYRAVTPQNGTVSLVRRDGVVLVHYPHDESQIGWKLPSASAWYESLGAMGGSYYSPGYRNNVARLVSVRPLRDFPLVINVSTSEIAALSNWRQQTLWLVAGALFAATCVIFLLRVFVGQVKRLEQSKASLARQNALLQQTAVALRESEYHVAENSRMLEATLEHMDQGLIVVDRERVVSICNRRAIELLGLPPELMARRPKFEEVLAFQWKQEEFVGSDDEFRSFVQRALLLEGPRNYQRRRPNGRVLEVRTTVLPEGEAVRTFTDVTERYNALETMALAKEQAEGANRAKSEFLTNMSHELRTPLSAVIGFSELIRDEAAGPVGTTYVSYAEDINASGRHLLKLINDLLDLSKIEAGRYELVEERVKLSNLLRICQRMMAQRAQSANVRIICDPNCVDVMLRIDLRATQQILLKLLDNAVKFSPAGGTTVIQVEPTTDGGMAVKVRDDGIGIEPEAASSLFEPFRQADASIGRKFDGSGLGLAISRKLMVLMDGTLEITSEPGEGTTVIMMFPAVRVIRDRPTLGAATPVAGSDAADVLPLHGMARR
jgi:signal transduction histidine kinase